MWSGLSPNGIGRGLNNIARACLARWTYILCDAVRFRTVTRIGVTLPVAAA
jgi:hypothetical protein